MEHIVVSIQPFDYTQTVCIYDNGECKKATQVNMDELADAIVNMVNSYGIHNIDIRGEKTYCEKVIQDIKEKNTILYNNVDLDIKLY